MKKFSPFVMKLQKILWLFLFAAGLVIFSGCAPKVDEDLLFAHMQKGLELSDSGKNKKAMDEFREAMEMAPELWDVHYEMGNALARDKQWSEAVLEYRKTIELNPDYMHVYRQMGKTLKEMGFPEAALKNYSLALERVTRERETLQHAMILKEKGELLRLTNNCEEAMEYYEQALKILPRYPRAVIGGAWCLKKMGFGKESGIVFNKAVLFTPKVIIGVAADGELELLKEMVSHGGNIHIQADRKEQYTPLMAAVAHGHPEVASWLLEKGADPDVANDCGTTALLIAVRKENPEMVKILISSDARRDTIDCLGTSAKDFFFENEIQ
jgi:tetratricopeptide (TPR) repeat protein